MIFTYYQTNNIKSLIRYLEDCLKYEQDTKEDYTKLNSAIKSLSDLIEQSRYQKEDLD